jgi:signal peptide peptidase SppA
VSRALSYALQQPWAITSEALQVVLEVAARENRDVETIEREMGAPLAGSERTTIRDGVAVIPVTGPLVRYGNLFSRISGATSAEVLSLDFHSAMENPQVTAVVLSVNSPGGQVDGIEEVAELIFEARGKKPIVAHVSGMGASGAYWLASAADEVVTVRTAVLGSIGAVLGVADYRKQDEKAGIQRMDIVSSVSPRKRLDPMSEEGAGQLQQMVDDIGEVFVAAVARNRGITREDVIAQYGQGGILVGERAVEAGLADRIASLEDVIEELRAGSQSAPLFGLGASVRQSITRRTEASMPPENVDTAAGASIVTVASIKQDHPQVAEALVAEGHELGMAEGRAAGVAAERERILGIQGLPAKGVDDVRAELVKDPSVSIDAAARKLLEAQAEKQRAGGEAFLRGRAEDENQVTAPVPSIEGAGSEQDQTVTLILNAGRQLAAREA